MRKLFFLFLLVPIVSAAQVIKGRVVSIADGDTFTMLTEGNKQIRVRLHGIDCPEKGQDYGKVAKDFLSGMIAGKLVNVKRLNSDRYGRTIGIVMIAGKNVNEALLKAGLAWHYKRYDKSTQWAAMESRAREEKNGLWSKPDPVSPWKWRKKPAKKSGVAGKG